MCYFFIKILDKNLTENNFLKIFKVTISKTFTQNKKLYQKIELMIVRSYMSQAKCCNNNCDQRIFYFTKKHTCTHAYKYCYEKKTSCRI